MTDNVSLSHSFSTTTTATPSTAAPELLAFADCELIPVDGRMTLAIQRRSGRQQLIANPVVDALMGCTTFATLEAHAQALAASRPELQGNSQLARQTLQQLEQAGILLRANDVCAALNLKTDAPAAAPARVFIITCDRPAAVRRLLDSLLRAGNLSQHEGLYLIDDSREAANCEANREAVAQFNRHSARDMHYVGAQAQAALLEALCAQLPEHQDGIRFLLDAQRWPGAATYGRARTLCLLLSVGYRALVMDDDILCETILPPVPEPGVSIGGGRRAAFFADREQLMQVAERAPFDPLSAHLTLLGSPLGPALQKLHDGAVQANHLDKANAALCSVLSADAPILVTQCGSWGDPGTASAHWAMHLDEESVSRLLLAEHGMAQALENRCNWFGSAQHRIFKMAVMSQLTGLDNRQLLPPYFPAYRGEDLLFGAMVQRLHPSSVVLDYPFSVPHLPLEERIPYSLREPVASARGIALLARRLVAHIDYRDPSSPEQRLTQLSLQAAGLAQYSDAQLLLTLRRELAAAYAEQLGALQRQLQVAQTLPAGNWQAYLSRGMEEVQQALATVQSPTSLRGIPADTSEQSLLTSLRSYAQHWSAALSAWPLMRETAGAQLAELHAQGLLAP